VREGPSKNHTSHQKLTQMRAEKGLTERRRQACRQAGTTTKPNTSQPPVFALVPPCLSLSSPSPLPLTCTESQKARSAIRFTRPPTSARSCSPPAAAAAASASEEGGASVKGSVSPSASSQAASRSVAGSCGRWEGRKGGGGGETAALALEGQSLQGCSLYSARWSSLFDTVQCGNRHTHQGEAPAMQTQASKQASKQGAPAKTGHAAAAT
jgi:hypothetical protein